MELIPRARAFALDAYGDARRLGHPLEVAELVRGVGGGEALYATAILHDLVEDTYVDVPLLRAEFGDEIAGWVAAMTEDGRIADYGERKREARLRARDAGPEVALLFVADKLSNSRRMGRGEKELDARKVAHYRATLELMEEAYPDLPLLAELRAAIPQIAPVLQQDERA